MNAAFIPHSANENKLIWALVLSVLLHVLFAVVVPKFKFDTAKTPPKILEVELQKPVPPAPVAAAEPIKPEPIKEIVKPKELEKPKPVKEMIKPTLAPEPVIQPVEPTTIDEPMTAPPPAPAVIAANPQPDVKPEQVAPVAPPLPPEPSPPDDNAISEYSGLLGRSIAKFKSYPRIATMRGWQGDVLLELKIDSDGKLVAANVRKGSGYEALDRQALEMVKKAQPFPVPPAALRNRSFTVEVPVSFKLENG